MRDAVAHSPHLAPHRTEERVAVHQKDHVSPVGWSTTLSDAFSDFTLTTLAGAGHFASMERPNKVARAVQDAWLAATRDEAEPYQLERSVAND